MSTSEQREEEPCSNDGSSDKPLTKSARRKLRRGPKTFRTGKWKAHKETLLLSRLPRAYKTKDVDSLVEKITGYNDQNSIFYTEIIEKPEYNEALVKFQQKEHLLHSYEQFKQINQAEIPLEVSIDNLDGEHSNLSSEYLLRARKHFRDCIRKLRQDMNSQEGTILTPTNSDKNVQGQSKDTDVLVNNEYGETSNNNGSTSVIYQIHVDQSSQSNSVDEHIEEFALNVALKREIIHNEEDCSNDSTETLLIKHEPPNFEESIWDDSTHDFSNIDLNRVKPESMDSQNCEEQSVRRNIVSDTNTHDGVATTETNRVYDAIQEVLSDFNVYEIKQERTDVEEPVDHLNNLQREQANAPSAEVYQPPSDSPDLVRSINYILSSETVVPLPRIFVQPSTRRSIDSQCNTNNITGDVVERNDIDETDENHCKVVHVKNLPLLEINRVRNMIQKLMREKKHDSKKALINVLFDEVEHTPSGEALVLMPTHEEAVRLSLNLHGEKLNDTEIHASLDKGHKVLKEHIKRLNEISNKSRKRANSGEQQDEAPTKKKARTEEYLTSFERGFIPPDERTYNVFGIRPNFLQPLGLKPPLSNIVIVKNLHEMVDEPKLLEVFSLAGSMRLLSYDQIKRKARIQYDHPVEAVQAIHMFRKQKLFGNEIIIDMDTNFQPQALPVGLSGVNKGFGKNGAPLKGARTAVELRIIHEILYELNKMNKFESNDISVPFNVWYSKKGANVFNNYVPTSDNNKGDNTSVNINTNTDMTSNNSKDNNNSVNNNTKTDSNKKSKKKKKGKNISSNGPDTNWDNLSVEVLNYLYNPKKSTNNKVPIPTSDYIYQIVEDIGAVMKAKCWLHAGIDCRNPENILAALVGATNYTNKSQFRHPVYKTVEYIGTIAKAKGWIPDSIDCFDPKSILEALLGDVHYANISHYRHLAHNMSRIPKLLDIPIPNPNLLVAHYSPNDTTNLSNWLPGSPSGSSVDNSPFGSQTSRMEPEIDGRVYRVIFQNLPPSMTQESLSRLLGLGAPVLHCSVAPHGTAIAAFPTFEDAQRCFHTFNRSKLEGNTIEVTLLT